MNKNPSAAKPQPTTNKPKKRNKPSIAVSEDMKIFIHQELDRFQQSTEASITFPATLTKAERAYGHEAIRPFPGLVSRSHGKGSNRQLTISKRRQRTKIRRRKNVEPILLDEMQVIVNELIRSVPLENASATAASGSSHLEINEKYKGESPDRKRLGVKLLNRRLIPMKARKIPGKILQDREALPIFQYREEIIKSIQREQVLIIQGDTGSGKTTQVPQYILEHAERYQKPCRIICTQPRRLATVNMAERVAYERGENVGSVIGYQIRLESRFHATTNLIYSTTGCMIRALMADTDTAFRGITHLIIDEIHERDKNTDFLLISLRDQLAENLQLKVILMSATMDIEQLSNYFNHCHILTIPGRCYEIRTFFLDDILYYTGYRNQKMQKHLDQIDKESLAKERAVKALKRGKRQSNQIDSETQNFVNGLLDCCYDPQCGIEDMKSMLDQLLYLIDGEGVPVNVQHSSTGITILMAAAMQNEVTYITRLQAMDADDAIVDNFGKRAIDYAAERGNTECCNQLNLSSTDTADTNSEKENLLLAYHASFADGDEIDHDLVLQLLVTINQSSNHGSVLVFLPGYNDMILLKDLIEQTLDSSRYILFLIHGSMNTHHHREVFQPSAIRKIILATNIAETSITFPDVAYVIDPGKVKQLIYDSLTGSSYLKSVDIAKACAMQRTGRAGRTQTGICYRLYSTKKYEAMSEYAVPEILRISLTEICLYAKAIDRNTSIAAYLSKALVPPSPIAINSAIQKLIEIGALNASEQITLLGIRLVNIPLDVQLGKMLLFGIMFRCLDPILSVVAYYSVKDPFLLPADRSERGRVNRMRKELCENYFSDHLGIIRLFQNWRKSQKFGTENHFLYDHNLSKASLEMMAGVRRQVAEYVYRTILPRDVNKNVLNLNANDWNLIRACLTAGLYPNVAFVNKKLNRVMTQFENLQFHMSSVLRSTNAALGVDSKVQTVDPLPTDWLIFHEKCRMGRATLIKYNTMVTPLAIILFCGSFLLEAAIAATTAKNDVVCSDDDDDDDDDDNDEAEESTNVISFKCDKLLAFKLNSNEFVLIERLKQCIVQSFNDFLINLGSWHPQKYSKLVVSLKELLAIDNHYNMNNMKQPFDDSYLPKRYDTMMNVGHFQVHQDSHGVSAVKPRQHQRKK